MKQSKWPDFLFTIVVRFLCGIAFGCLAWFFSYRFILRAFSHNNIRGPLLWLVVCGLAGGIIASSPCLLYPTGRHRGIKEFEVEMVTRPNRIRRARRRPASPINAGRFEHEATEGTET